MAKQLPYSTMRTVFERFRDSGQAVLFGTMWSDAMMRQPMVSQQSAKLL